MRWADAPRLQSISMDAAPTEEQGRDLAAAYRYITS